MEFLPGVHVQAVDQIGRYEQVKVLAIKEGQLEIRFLGWGKDYDMWVPIEDVRFPEDTFTRAVIGKYNYLYFLIRLKRELF